MRLGQKIAFNNSLAQTVWANQELFAARGAQKNEKKNCKIFRFSMPRVTPPRVEKIQKVRIFFFFEHLSIQIALKN